ncbi:DUF4097 family beta strand repeat protein [candidate division KSB1 bacterium]|nr:DUF4097 domain-containing protein [bacterium]NUM65323.1 DUF4097 family beta strand repeat protein [candidate division KSB1 bacterium]
MKTLTDTRRMLWLLVSLAWLPFSACEIDRVVDAGGQATERETFSFQVEAVNQSRLRVEGINGPVEIVGVPGATTVEIWGERRVTSQSHEDAAAYLRHLEVRVSDSREEVLVKTIQPNDTHGRTLEVVYHLRLPAAWQVQVKNVNGNVRVDSLQQQAKINLANGNVELYEISGTATAALTNGNLVMRGVHGNVSGELINGNILVETRLVPNGVCELSAVNGIISLQIPKATSAELEAKVSNGTINLSGLTLQVAASSPQTLRGRLGAGEGRIALATVNGNILVAGF